MNNLTLPSLTIHLIEKPTFNTYALPLKNSSPLFNLLKFIRGILLRSSPEGTEETAY